MSVCHMCVACVSHVCLEPTEYREASEPLGLGFQVVVGCHIGVWS